MFLQTVKAYPHLGCLVAHLTIKFGDHSCDDDLDYEHGLYDSPGDDDPNDLFALAMISMPNVQTLLLRNVGRFSECLTRTTFPVSGELRYQRNLQTLFLDFKSSQYGDEPVISKDQLAPVLVNHPNLRHLAVLQYNELAVSPNQLNSIRPALEGACPSLSVLEGCNSVVVLLLAKRNIQYLFWLCEHPIGWFVDVRTNWFSLP